MANTSITTVPYQQTNNRQLNQFQQALSSSLQSITSNPIASCQIIANVALTAGQINNIPIGLSQPLQGWFLVRNQANANVWDSQSTNNNPSQILVLNTTANTTVSIAIF